MKNEKLKPGTLVKVPHFGKCRYGFIVRHDNGHPWDFEPLRRKPFHVVDIGEYSSIIVPCGDEEEVEYGREVKRSELPGFTPAPSRDNYLLHKDGEDYLQPLPYEYLNGDGEGDDFYKSVKKEINSLVDKGLNPCDTKG